MRVPSRTRLCFALVLLAGVSGASRPGVTGIAWDPVVDIAGGGGSKGPWKQNDSHYDYVDDGTAAYLAGGELAVAWVDQRRKDVLLQVLGPDGRARAAPIDVSRSPATFSWMPRIASGAPGTIHVLWQEIIFSGGSHGGDILFARSLDGGQSFSPPINLSRSIGGDGKGRLDRDTWSNGSLDLATGPDGSVYAVWTEYGGALWLARSRDGASFTRPRRVAGDAARPARAPSIVVGSKGQVYLAWTVGEDPDADIRVSQSRDGGDTFAPPVLVGAKKERADAPRLALGRDGRLHLVYMEQAADKVPSIRYLMSDGPALRFGAPRTLSGSGEAATAPQLATDAQGRVVVAWEPTARRGMRVTVMEDTGFGEPVKVPGSRRDDGGRNGSQQGLLGKKLAVAPGGGIALVNSTLAPGQGSRVWLMRGRVNAAPK